MLRKRVGRKSEAVFTRARRASKGRAFPGTSRFQTAVARIGKLAPSFVACKNGEKPQGRRMVTPLDENTIRRGLDMGSAGVVKGVKERAISSRRKTHQD